MICALGGYTVPVGTVVVLVSMSANHDTAVLPDADRFDIERMIPDGWHLLTFAGAPVLHPQGSPIVGHSSLPIRWT